jgi:hypothetical protein
MLFQEAIIFIIKKAKQSEIRQRVPELCDDVLRCDATLGNYGRISGLILREMLTVRLRRT